MNSRHPGSAGSITAPAAMCRADSASRPTETDTARETIAHVATRLTRVAIATTQTSTVRSCVERNISTITARTDDTMDATAAQTTTANCAATRPRRLRRSTPAATSITTAVQIAVVRAISPMSGRASIATTPFRSG
ncbi:hypothetical protein ACFOJ6_02405 [Gordonia humi]|uniref:hypothetical protein n=1 Tax=Gordonia humi TaxID=686429 RepID=UPI003608602C